MISINSGRPAADECIPYFARYIDLVPDGDIGKILERQIADTAALLASYTPAQAQWRPAPEEWSATEIVGHLADTEWVFVYRALRIARADPLPWTPAELEVYVAAADFQHRPLGDVTAEYVSVRAATVSLLRGLDQAAWERRAPEGWSCRSVRAIAYNIAGHELHHAIDLRRYREMARDE